MGSWKRERVLKYASAGVCALCLLTMLLSTQRAVDWHSPSTRYGAALSCGALMFAWRPAGWNAATDPFKPQPGVTMSGYGSPCPMSWWPQTSASPSWRALSVPIWAVAAPAVAMLIACLRKERRGGARRVRAWRRRERVSRRAAARGAAVVGVAAVLSLSAIVPQITAGIGRQTWIDAAIDEAGLPVGLVLSLALGLVLSLSYALGRLVYAMLQWKRVAMPDGHCDDCDYDLTGNTSGVCPECGRQL